MWPGRNRPLLPPASSRATPATDATARADQLLAQARTAEQRAARAEAAADAARQAAERADRERQEARQALTDARSHALALARDGLVLESGAASKASWRRLSVAM